MHRTKKIGAGGGNRRLKTMHLHGFSGSLRAGGWFPAADIYEIEARLLVFVDVSGIEPSRLSVLVAEDRITLSGERRCPLPEQLSCVHRLEIESGFFERTIILPKPVDVASAVSECRNGILAITLPLRRNRGKVRIPVA